MATKMKRLSLYIRTIILLVWTGPGAGYNCPYGRHCGYDPAPPGRSPPCALPGLTYCVHPEPYPEDVIRQLVEAGHYDIRTLLSDETKDDFNKKRSDYPYGYGPNSLPNVDDIMLVNDPFYTKNYNNFHNSFNHGELCKDIFNQKTPLQPPSEVDPVPYNINLYHKPIQQNFTKFNTIPNYQPSTYWTPQTKFTPNYDKKLYPTGFGGYTTNNFYTGSTFDPNLASTDWTRQAASSTQYNPNEWWRYVSPSRSDVTIQRSLTFPTRTSTHRRNTTSPTRRRRRRRNAELVRASRRRPLSGAEALQIALGIVSAETSAERPRRQAGEVEELCRVRTQFVSPRAALNNKGNWKYIVNMPSNMTQLVRAEICVSTECSGLCSVPIGYKTKCEQKYIQKRLVALETNGQNLYTDLFWIPSCCQCSIVQSNN